MTNQYLWTRIAGQSPNLRASDADRERVADRLRTSHTEGRLDITEFQQRLDRCYEAKTYAELGELVSDLPRPQEPRQQSGFGQLRAWPWRVVALLGAVIVISAAAGGHHHVAWRWIPLVFLFWKLSWFRRRRWLASVRRGPEDWI